MEINNELFKYDNCINNAYLKCTEESNCMECLRIENRSAQRWIDYVNNKVGEQSVLELEKEPKKIIPIKI